MRLVEVGCDRRFVVECVVAPSCWLLKFGDVAEAGPADGPNDRAMQRRCSQTPIEAARRECLEEIGVDLAAVRLQGRAGDEPRPRNLV